MNSCSLLADQFWAKRLIIERFAKHGASGSLLSSLEGTDRCSVRRVMSLHTVPLRLQGRQIWWVTLPFHSLVYRVINWEIMSFNKSLNYQSLFESATRERAPIIKVAWSNQAPQVYATLRPTDGWLESYFGGAECVRSMSLP